MDRLSSSVAVERHAQFDSSSSSVGPNFVREDFFEIRRRMRTVVEESLPRKSLWSAHGLSFFPMECSFGKIKTISTRRRVAHLAGWFPSDRSERAHVSTAPIDAERRPSRPSLRWRRARSRDRSSMDLIGLSHCRRDRERSVRSHQVARELSILFVERRVR